MGVGKASDMAAARSVATGSRDHLFVSYAYEDEALAEWLALRLTSEGYKVWIDRFKLLGGESYPRDIDKAIKERAFRVLALLSRHSLYKPNPVKERTLALNLQRHRQEELLIPLNVDNLRPDELDWMTSDITFIPFWDSWATGLAQLCKKLVRVDAPRQVKDGMRIAANASLTTRTVSEQPERVYANILPVVRVPVAISCFAPAVALSSDEERALVAKWAFWALRPKRLDTATRDPLYFSFDQPPRSSQASYRWVRKAVAAWRDVRHICGIETFRIPKPLIRRVLVHHLRNRGLRPTPDDPHTLYVPPGLLPKNRLRFTRPDGRETYRKAVGERAWPRGARFVYHQAVTFDIRTDLHFEFAVQFRIRLHITDCGGKALNATSANARRKLLTRTWYNDEWLARHLALVAFLADGKDAIEIGDSGSLALSSSILELTAASGIDEAEIPKGIALFRPRNSPEENRVSVTDRGLR